MPRVVDEYSPPTEASSGSGAEGVDSNEEDETVVPQRFINAEKGNKVKGRKRYVVTMTWRLSNHLDSILDRPHPLMRFIKAHTNHYFYGKGKDGNSVYYETPKAAKLDVFDKVGVSVDELLYHFVYISEFLYQRMDSREFARCISVVDCTDVGMGDLRGKVKDYLGRIAQITQTHYPERSAGIIIVNAPFAFRVVWAIVKQFMDPVTLSKTHLYGFDYIEQVKKYIDLAQVPEEFGGKTPFKSTLSPTGPQLPPSALGAPFSTQACLPKSIDEENMFKVADQANVQFVKNRPSEALPRATLVGAGNAAANVDG